MSIKQLEVRNTPGGMIWQIYHIDTDAPHEKILLEKAARSNGFQSIKVVDELDCEESLAGWRETPEWKAYCKKEGVHV